MSQVPMDCEARVPRYWPKSCRGGCAPTDMVYNKSPNISRIAPKEWQYCHQLISSERPNAARGLLATDHILLNHGQVTWTTPELATPSPNYHTNGRTFQLWTDSACTAALHGGSLVVLVSNS
ncbi:hypothetical protein TNCV_505641 [Trichonephila clavipes]|nr:hypothetical protein TNCV_505641 [Trichonephila clavipes]